jgi:hypothetical protein
MSEGTAHRPPGNGGLYALAARAVIAGALLIDGIFFYWKGFPEDAFVGRSPERVLLQLERRRHDREHHPRDAAHRRRSGRRTFTLLNTAPVRDWEIVVGKVSLGAGHARGAHAGFMPALIFVNGKLASGIVVGYAGLLPQSARRRSRIRLFASALTKSQVVAAIVGTAFPLR